MTLTDGKVVYYHPLGQLYEEQVEYSHDPVKLRKAILAKTQP